MQGKHFIIGLLSTVLSITVFCQDNPVHSFLQGNTHAAVAGNENYSGPGKLRLTVHTAGKIFSSPVIDEGIIYVGSDDGNLYATDIASQKTTWKFSAGGAIPSSPAIYGNAVYFTSYNGYLYALNKKTGKTTWKFKTGGEKRLGRKGMWTMKPLDEYMIDPFDFFLSSPAIDAGKKLVIFGSSDGNVYALNAGNGKQAWKFKTGGLIHSSPALANGVVYIGSWDQNLYALESATGKELWRFKTGADTAYHLLEGIQGSAAVANNAVYFGCRDGYFYSVNATTGKMNWKYSANSSWILTTPVVKEHSVYFGTSDSYLFIALDTETGKELFHVKANGYVYASPLITGHTAYFGDFSGNLLASDLNGNGKIHVVFETAGRKKYGSEILLKNEVNFQHAAKGLDLSLFSSTLYGMKKLYLLGPIVSSPCISKGVLYFGSSDGNLYGVELRE